jgi:hypothetical protein
MIKKGTLDCLRDTQKGCPGAEKIRTPLTLAVAVPPVKVTTCVLSSLRMEKDIWDIFFFF